MDIPEGIWTELTNYYQISSNRTNLKVIFVRTPSKIRVKTIEIPSISLRNLYFYIRLFLSLSITYHISSWISYRILHALSFIVNVFKPFHRKIIHSMMKYLADSTVFVPFNGFCRFFIQATFDRFKVSNIPSHSSVVFLWPLAINWMIGWSWAIYLIHFKIKCWYQTRPEHV